MRAFTVYTLPGCPFCSLVKLELRKRGEVYTEVVMPPLMGEAYAQWKAEHGITTFPLVKQGNRTIGGCMETISYLTPTILH